MQPFPFGSVNRAIAEETGEGPTADALRDLARAAVGAALGGSSLGVVYRPGAPTAPPYYATWGEVQAIVALEQGDLVVFLDDSFVSPLPITGASDGFGRLVISPARYFFAGSLLETKIADGAYLDNIRAFVGAMKIISLRTGAVPPLQHSAVNVTQLSNGAQLVNDATATQPFIDIAPGEVFALAMTRGAGLDNSANNAVPIVDLLVGGQPAQHAWFTFDGFQFNGATLVRGGVNAQFQYTHDLSSGAVDVTGIVGGQTQRQLLDASAQYTYKPGAPWQFLGATEFSLWSDVVANMDPSNAGPKVIGPRTLYIDSAFAPGGIADVPAGTYGFNGPVSWRGVNSSLGSKVRFLDGAKLSDSFEFRDLQIEVTNTVDPLIGTAAQQITLSGCTSVTVSGSKPFLEPTIGSTRVVLRDRAQIAGTPATPAVGVLSLGARMDVSAHEESRIELDALGYAAGTDGNVLLDDAAFLDYAQAHAPAFAPDTLAGIPQLVTGGSYRQPFTNADIQPGNTITITHDLSEKFACVEVYDGGDKVVLADNVGLTVTAIDESQVELDFAAPIVGTYHVVVRRLSAPPKKESPLP